MPDSAPAAQPFAGPRRAGGWLTTLGWAAYLACSWTWCIGMFLPALLVRDFGIWGFIVFAVPNVVGAASVGWVLRRESQLAMIMRVHARAVAGFSLATRMFQLYFLVWLSFTISSRMLVGSTLSQQIAIDAALFATFFASGFATMVTPHKPRIATALWLFSIGVGLYLVLGGGAAEAWNRLMTHSGDASPEDLAWLAPVCAFGFLLCPYLDITFLSARALNPGAAGRRAFSLAFGALFPPMIVLTLAYAGWLIPMETIGSLVLAGSVAAMLVLLHISLQLGLTFGLHAQANLFPTFRIPRPWERTAQIATLVAAVLGAQHATYHGLSLGEVIYRLFIAFYGLVFPAYVWLCMIPTGGETDGHSGPSRAKVRVWLLSVGVAAPMFWMGFIERQTWWLAPGLGVVLLARLVLPRRPRSDPGPA